MTCSRNRLISIIDRRNREALCVIRTDEYSEDAELINVDDIDELETSTVDYVEDNSDSMEKIEQENLEKVPFPIIKNLSNWISSPWEDE